MSPREEVTVLGLLQEQHRDVCERLDQLAASIVALTGRMDLHEQHDQHIEQLVGKRLESLENDATATGRHHVVKLEKTIDTWKGRFWNVVAVLITSSILAMAARFFLGKS